MRLASLSAVLAVALGCSTWPEGQSSQESVGRHISVVPAIYHGSKTKQMPLGKCVVAPVPPPTETVDTLEFLIDTLRGPPILTPDDALAVYVTPKRMLTSLDLVRKNQWSRWDGATAMISFDFVEYAGDIDDLPGPMACVVQCYLGKLPAGCYRATVMNAYYQYLRVGEADDAKPVPKTRIHPDTFWYDIEFAVAAGKGDR